MSTIALPDLAYVIDNLDEGILFLDKDRQVVAINRTAMDILGQTRLEQGGDIIGTLCPSLFPGTTCAHECEQSGKCSLIQQKIQGREKTEHPTFRQPDGTMVSLSLRALALSPSEPLARCAILLKNRSHEQRLEDEISERFRLGSLIGHSVPMRNLFQDILKAAASEATVLIEGESGTGKELVARALHENSRRAASPYVRVHCSALAENLLESELFGHARGAFTGAVSARPGRFEAADGGTLLLDEIGEISPGIQVKLLRVLQEREVERLGENQPRKVDVRIIAATNRDLTAMVQDGTFRKDLYYRLRVLPVQVPALRERQGDIPLLADHLLAEMAGRYKREKIDISEDAVCTLEGYDWPGNVRELVNTLEYALVHADGAVILPRHFPPEIKAVPSWQSPPPAPTIPDAPMPARLTRYYRAPGADEERILILRTLDEAQGNKAEAARRLGMSRTTLWKRLRTYGLV